jgi:hypothetical protein
MSTGFETTAKKLRKMGFVIPDSVSDERLYLLHTGESEIGQDGSLSLNCVLLPVVEITFPILGNTRALA